MHKSTQLILDVSLAATLALGLVCVGFVDRNRPSKATSDLGQSVGGTLAHRVVYDERADRDATGRRDLRLAVSTHQYDDMGSMLRILGDGYPFTTLTETQLADESVLKNFDVLFLTCAEFKGVKDRATAVAVRNFVESGKTLYGSDRRFELLQLAFPAQVEGAIIDGERGDVTARVTDAGLREFLGGREVPLHFDLPGWRPALFRRDVSAVLLEGDHPLKGVSRTSPLLVKFPAGRGTVIFTSFHNSKQNAELEIKLLKYLVLDAVTAGLERQSNETMRESGFVPRQSSLISASVDAPTVINKYVNAKSGKLRFNLAFESRPGTKLGLTIRAPDGKWASAEHTARFAIEVHDAMTGEWEYSVTARQLPYPNFPFRVLIGAEK